MPPNEDHGPDAQSIKPVSSLLSHFEGLKSNIHSSHAKPNDRSPLAARASFDTPRPSSPWNTNTDPVRHVPQTPVARQRRDGDSPTKSGHKRPMSMHITSSPQLGPSVNVESPKSPPRSFFRSSSRSPERVDNTPFGKVKHIISSHSSRTSTRPPSPGADGGGSPKRLIQSTNWSGSGTSSPGRSISPTRPPPPPVNRAEKPKIPVKPLKVSQTVPVPGRLTPEPLSAAPAAHISPFSTPPSSDGTPTPPEERVSPDFPPASQNSLQENGMSQSRDPRFLGFSSASVPTRANTVGERRIPKDLGSSKRHVSEHIQAQPPPPPQLRDARQYGFSGGGVREITEEPSTMERMQQRQIPSPPQDARRLGFPDKDVVEESAVKERKLPPPSDSASIRDARQFGFSNAARRDDRPDLPTRRTIQAPPPRPSEESKNSVGRRQPPPQAVPERTRQASVPQIPKSVVSTSGDMRFPPPPKRNTFNGEQTITPPSTSSQANATLSGPRINRENSEDSDEAEKGLESSTIRTDYPDATQSNRRPPYNLSGEREIRSKSDGRVMDVCGKYLCVSGYVTRVFDMSTNEQVLGLNHGEVVKITAVKFKPSADMNKEGSRLWLGSNVGDLQELDISTHSVMASSLSHNRKEVIRILRHHHDLWTIDDDGKLFVWFADETGEPSLKYSHVTHKIPRGHTFSMVVRDKLWLATGKEIRIFKPGNEATFTTLTSPLAQPSVGDVTSGTYSNEKGGRAYFGHSDGKVSIYSTTDYKCIGVVKASDYRINTLCFVGDRLWTGYKTGKVYVYDTSCTPWKVKKDWDAHSGPVSGMILDPRSFWTLSRLQVVTTGHDDVAKLWDATLEADWMESAMQERDVEYCQFREVRAAVVTWNVGATDPMAARHDFIADAIHSEDPPEILAFGFQEVVDLEDKAITAKSILGFAKKKDSRKDSARTEQHQSRVYREWRDALIRSLDRLTTGQNYMELQTSSLVGLFQCVFIRGEQRSKVTNVSTTSIKCGMGGHYGNKGALVTRFVLDDSSLCFVNCHLAAGQTQTRHRNNDIASILESDGLPSERDHSLRSSLFVGGGDGTQILDHEICILNGDLNYRIDTIPRDTVVKMIKNNELAKLMERDQLLVCRRRTAGFRLAPFTELPITFAPTYKYDVNTDDYDSSEKKRAPAWCDRLLFRGPGRIKQVEYRRHEVRVSDHRPVSGIFKIRIKKVDPVKRDKVRVECLERFQGVRKQMCEDVCIKWLVEIMGFPQTEARRMITA